MHVYVLPIARVYQNNHHISFLAASVRSPHKGKLENHVSDSGSSLLHLFFVLFQALVKVNVKLKPMLDSVAANRSKWEELHQKRLLVPAASPSSASLVAAGEDRN